MFTGIIAGQGEVLSLHLTGDFGRLELDAGRLAQSMPIGGSIAVNGVCLTAVAVDAQRLELDVMGETLQRTNLGALAPGSRVNLERCVAAGSLLDGHVVQGHVDSVGTIAQVSDHENWRTVRITVPTRLAKYLASKGAIAVDGISLTVTAVSGAKEESHWFEVGVIPQTLAETSLGWRKPGDEVNLETDVLAKYTERLLAFAGDSGQSR